MIMITYVFQPITVLITINDIATIFFKYCVTAVAKDEDF